jgi:hypothetical protein
MADPKIVHGHDVGAARGDAGVERADAGPVPRLFVAVTEKV